MKSYKDLEVNSKKVKMNGKFVWKYQFSLDGIQIAEKVFSMKQNRLDDIAFNVCQELKRFDLIHPSSL